MKKVIAIHPDRFRTDHGIQSFSDKWVEYLNDHADYSLRIVDIYSGSGLSDLENAAAFLWRPIGARHASAAKRIIPAIEYGLAIPTFPSSRMAWITRDKLAQTYLMEAAQIPAPKSWIFFSLDEAVSFLKSASYPLVVKLSGGRGSSDVAIIHDAKEGSAYVHEMFHFGVTTLTQAFGSPAAKVLSRTKQASRFFLGRENPRNREGAYAYFQEFLHGNDGDTRVTIIGNYATAFRRMNRPGDFRASGSGLIDWNPEGINLEAVRLAHKVSKALKCPFVAVDVLFTDDVPVVCELNFAYLTWPVSKCPGYWKLPEAARTLPYEWIEEPLNPELLTLQEFLRIHKL